MTRDEQVEILVRSFPEASRLFLNPGEDGYSPKTYSEVVAADLRRVAKRGLRKDAVMTVSEGLDLADALERGEFKKELGALMGFS